MLPEFLVEVARTISTRVFLLFAVVGLIAAAILLVTLLVA
jgi:hypothetical protein